MRSTEDEIADSENHSGDAVISEDLVLHEMHYENGVINMKVGGEPAKAFMTALVEFFKQNGGKNYLTLTVAGQGEKYGITIENCHGVDTPAERLHRMETLLQNVDRACDGAGHPLPEFETTVATVRLYLDATNAREQVS